MSAYFPKQDKDVVAAAEALADLNLFAAISELCKNGLLHSPSYRGANRIRKICWLERRKRLCEYDRAVARALKKLKA